MAKFEERFKGDLDDFLAYIEKEVVAGSISATFEDGINYTQGNTHFALRVFERYSWTGKNRLSLNISMLHQEGILYLVAVSAGGSGGLFFKLNTLGESAFLDKFKTVVTTYKNLKGVETI